MINEITASKIKLKFVEKSDSEKIYALRKNPHIAQYISRDIKVALSDIEKSIEDRLTGFENILFYKIETIPDQEFVGTLVLKNINRERKSAEIGYEILPQYEGKGFMIMALNKIIEIAFENIGLKTLTASTHQNNLKSRKLLEKLTFQKTDKKDPLYSNAVIYRLTSTI